MPIPFRDLGEEVPYGVAGFLRFVDEPDGKGIRGALFVMSTRAEPLHFTFSRIDVQSGVLWRLGEARRQAVSSLAKALFEASGGGPDLILILAEEAPPRVFTEDLQVGIPLCLVATVDADSTPIVEETERVSESLSLVWLNGQPRPNEPGGKTVEALRNRQLLLEPFERAAIGLREAFET